MFAIASSPEELGASSFMWPFTINYGTLVIVVHFNPRSPNARPNNPWVFWFLPPLVWPGISGTTSSTLTFTPEGSLNLFFAGTSLSLTKEL